MSNAFNFNSQQAIKNKFTSDEQNLPARGTVGEALLDGWGAVEYM